MEEILESKIKHLKNTLHKNNINLNKLTEDLVNFKKIIVICGPTCTGKSKIGIIMAKLLDTDIISMDSMQVYKGMNIGTDKYNTKKYNVKQYMIDIFNPDHNLSVIEFKEICDEIIKINFFSLNKIPLLVGGSGLYIRSVINGIDKVPDESREIREKIKEGIKKNGIRKYYLKLMEIDKEYAKKISENDQRRIVRALEVYEKTGLPFSSFQKAWKNKKQTYDAILIGIKMERNKLYRRIEERVEKMFKNGLVDEVKELISKGYKNCRSITQAVGYKEVLKYLNGKTTLENCMDEVKKNTRRLAKKQMTWFNADPKINWLIADNYDNIFYLITDIFKIIKSKYLKDEKN